ncbi:hypothetical protein BJX64DRAFT_282986 [Aspergillus heterothallicus]
MIALIHNFNGAVIAGSKGSRREDPTKAQLLSLQYGPGDQGRLVTKFTTSASIVRNHAMNLRGAAQEMTSQAQYPNRQDLVPLNPENLRPIERTHARQTWENQEDEAPRETQLHQDLSLPRDMGTFQRIDQAYLPSPLTCSSSTAAWPSVPASICTPTGSSFIQGWNRKQSMIPIRGTTPDTISGCQDEGICPVPSPVDKPYTGLNALQPWLKDVLSMDDAREMLDIYFDPNTSGHLLKSPYVLTDIIHPARTHSASPHLVLAALFCVAHTTGLEAFTAPGARQRITLRLYQLVLDHMKTVDVDNYIRTIDGWQFRTSRDSQEKEAQSLFRYPERGPRLPEALGSTDRILALATMTMVVSNSRFNAGSFKWWAKTTRLAHLSGLSMTDHTDPPLHTGMPCLPEQSLRNQMIVREERRRLFWLIYCLDRHLVLLFNTTLDFPDGSFCVAAPLPETLWRQLGSIDLNAIPFSCEGPPTSITGYSLLDCILPLFTTLGSIIDLHHLRSRSVIPISVEDAVTKIEILLTNHEKKLYTLRTQLDGSVLTTSSTDQFYYTKTHKETVLAYSTYMIHVMCILLHGPWDPICLLDATSNGDDDSGTWSTLTSSRTCAAHALSAVSAVEQILVVDPELTFLPYQFGILLFHGTSPLVAILERRAVSGLLLYEERESSSSSMMQRQLETMIRAYDVSLASLDSPHQVQNVFLSSTR